MWTGIVATCVEGKGKPTFLANDDPTLWARTRSPSLGAGVLDSAEHWITGISKAGGPH